MNKRLLVQEALQASENPRHLIRGGTTERLGSMNIGRRLSVSSACTSEQHFVVDGIRRLVDEMKR